jgi:predicted GH43/DUF377 family glycosyl hydrolase
MKKSELFGFLITCSSLLLASIPQKDKQKEAYPTWAFGPFIKRDKPIIEPSYGSIFHCPILNREVHWEAQNVYNPASVVKDGRVWILYRADDAPRGGVWGRTCRIGLAYSDDGISFMRYPEPVLYPDKDSYQSIEWEGGIEDIHIIEGENGVYYVNYTAWTGSHQEICTASSKDLIHWVKHGPAFAKSGKEGSADHRTGVILSQLVGEKLLPAKLNGKYLMYYTHPCAIATSDDLINWEPTGEAVFKVGGEVPGHSRSHESGAIALVREEGILLMVNGSSDLYGRQAGWYLGQYLLDKNDGKTIIGDPGFSFLYAEKDWEKFGFAKEAFVSNGMVFFKGRWFLYYGAADRCIGVAIYDPKNTK